MISHGRAHWVNVGNPSDCRTLDFVPGLSVRALPVQNALLLADLIALALVGGDGVLWRSLRLSWDELRIVNLEKGIALGVGYDPTNLSHGEFSF